MPSSPRIEAATVDDVDALAEYWVALARQQREHGSHVLPDANRGTIRETLAAHRVADGLLVARLGNELVGFVAFSPERGTFALDETRGVVSNLYVRPGYRDDGIGTALLEAAEAELGERGIDLVTLEVMADNEAARRFYRSNGYDEHRVAMERPLDDGRGGDSGENADSDESDTHSKDRG